MDDFQGNLLSLDFLKRLDDGFNRPLSVSLHYDLENLGLCRIQSREEVFQSHFVAGFRREGAGFLHPLIRQCPRRLFILNHVKFQAGLRHAVQSQNLDGHRGGSLFQARALFVNERADLPHVPGRK